MRFSWDAKQYEKFLTERTRPAVDLASRIKGSPKKVLDLGCGPGNSTAVLVETFPNAQISGADFSEEMLVQARANLPQLEFIPFDASHDFKNHGKKYDVIFSNACIQWVPNHAKLFKDMFACLNNDGQLALQVPLTDKVLLETLIADLASSEKWLDKMSSASFYHTQSLGDYIEILLEQTSDFELWETCYYHRLPSLQSITDWYRGTGLRPHLGQLSAEEQEIFCQELLEKMKIAYPLQTDGSVIFPFPRLFILARKE